MTVNVAKSKVTIFRRGGRVASTDVFYYDNERLEVCNEYNYLGVLFSSHGVFHKAAEQALSRGRVAVGNVRQILVKSKSDTLESRMKLFHAIVKSTLLYGAEIWASRYGETIEKCQTLFLKSLYCLPKCTQSNMLRAEMGVVKLSYYAFSQTLEWWSKILKMSLDRYPRMCYEQLLSMDQRSSNIMKYNWCTLLKNKLVELELADVWEAQCSATLEGRKQEILNTYYSKLIEEDWTSLTHSSYNILFKEIKVKPENVSPDRSFVSPYLLEQAPIERSRVAAQLRLCGRNVKIYINRMTYGWNQEEICTTCNQRKPEDIQHFLVDCPQYSSLRSSTLQRSPRWSLRSYQSLLGQLNFAAFAVPLGRLHLRPLHIAARTLSKSSPRKTQAMPPTAMEAIEWWMAHLEEGNSYAIAKCKITLSTDASDWGLGVLINSNIRLQQEWNRHQRPGT
ncbi:hypothetical protein M8J77_022466 [Diaphorina citri]|nr:hypothetical protein M8J77_022466 [Diaphorina citri]